MHAIRNKLKANAGRKHALLKKMVKGQKLPHTGLKAIMPIPPQDNGLGKPRIPGDGGGSNLGTSGVF